MRRFAERQNGSKLQVMASVRKLAVLERDLQSYKRYVFAVARGDVKRIHSLTTVALYSKRSIHAIVDRINYTLKHVHTTKSYDEQDYQRSFLFYQPGGFRLADIAHRSLGLPSVGRLRKHILSPPIQAFPTTPTYEQVKQNLLSALHFLIQQPLEDRPTGRIGIVIMIDEIALAKRLRWDPKPNTILGTCREHGKKCTLVFHSMNEANLLRHELNAGGVHLAKEVHIVDSIMQFVHVC